ncbi:hypothetical protein [Embleya sp. NPDC005575]|uniref:hypothetical protein n=1 Tax=Embleya sp. NPDC005575 TaxID=3156892 RepID=UPI00339DF92C
MDIGVGVVFDAASPVSEDGDPHLDDEGEAFVGVADDRAVEPVVQQGEDTGLGGGDVGASGADLGKVRDLGQQAQVVAAFQVGRVEFQAAEGAYGTTARAPEATTEP